MVHRASRSGVRIVVDQFEHVVGSGQASPRTDRQDQLINNQNIWKPEVRRRSDEASMTTMVWPATDTMSSDGPTFERYILTIANVAPSV